MESKKLKKRELLVSHSENGAVEKVEDVKVLVRYMGNYHKPKSTTAVYEHNRWMILNQDFCLYLVDALMHKDMSKTAVRLLFYMLANADFDNIVYIGMQTEIAQALGINESTVNRAIAQLFVLGFIVKDPKFKQRYNMSIDFVQKGKIKEANVTDEDKCLDVCDE